MTWPQVREMATAGMEFGSHTVTHPVLPHVSNEGRACGLAWSRRTLEQRLRRDCKVFCCPMGLADARMETAAVEAGYDSAVRDLPGINACADMHPSALRRLHVERYTGAPFFETMPALPSLFVNY